MSLNGLDANAVIDAHQSTLADPGGWFLLRYENRDTVVVLSQGNGGVAEAKGAVEQYEEKSPLHGMLQYRRKRVLLKYVPEGTSRLLQVRLTVQFQSIVEAFPHDTIFTFTAAAELVESALGLCTMLQPTNGGSLKSSDSSLTQRRLNEISEDVEDTNMPIKVQEKESFKLEYPKSKPLREHNEVSTLPESALRAKALLAKRKEEAQQQRQSELNSPTKTSEIVSVSAPHTNEKYPEIRESPRPYSSLGQAKIRHEAEPVISPPTVAIQPVQEESTLYHHSRHLSENESNNISQWNDQVTPYTVSPPKPKKKLAPRPHVEPQNRPKTANVYDDNTPVRQVANLPHSVRVPGRPHTSLSNRPGSAHSSRSVPARFLAPPSPAPPLPDYIPSQPSYRRPESVRPASRVSSSVADAPPINPEKMRLMKALQKRKRDQMLAQRAASAQPTSSSYQDDFPLGVRQPLEPIDINPLPTIVKVSSLPATNDTKSLHNSSTASPTSAATISENPSTRPSSFDGEQESKKSQTSESLDTDSSSTPKAEPEPEPVRVTPDKHMSWFDSAPDLPLDKEEPRVPEALASPTDTVITPVRTAFIELPAIPQSPIDLSTPRAQDKSTLSWLASDSQLEIVQAIVHKPENQTKAEDEIEKAQPLGTDALVQPTVEASSNISEEDAFELHDATVHEAKHISVLRAPKTPTMRTFSIERGRITPTPPPSRSPKSSKSTHSVNDQSPVLNVRSPSTALPTWPPAQNIVVPLTKKSTLGHGISQRIKALEETRRESGSYSTSPPNESAAGNSTFSNLMKRTSFISQFQSSGVSAEKPPKSANPSIDRSSTMRPWTQRKSSAGAPFQPASSTENTSVTGRPAYRQADSSSSSVNHSRQPSTTTHSSHTADTNNRSLMTPSSPVSERKRFSFASYRSGSTTKWMQPESMTSKVSVATKEGKVSRAPSETSSVQDEKRGSRTSRIMKRMSGFGRFGGKAQPPAVPPVVQEESRPAPIVEQNEIFSSGDSIAESAMQMIDIGNVNVQFPETLLWKRRFLRVDDQGYLVFTATTENQYVRTTNRKFHLADVQEPCLPDSEREEIAWSVLLDLRDGNCIQCACESKEAQTEVLRMLLDAHHAYHSLYPDALE